RWFHRPGRGARLFRRLGLPALREGLPAGRYALRQKTQGLTLSFRVRTPHSIRGEVRGFTGTLEAKPDRGVQLVLDVQGLDPGETPRQVYQLVEVPGCDSADG